VPEARARCAGDGRTYLYDLLQAQADQLVQPCLTLDAGVGSFSGGNERAQQAGVRGHGNVASTLAFNAKRLELLATAAGDAIAVSDRCSQLNAHVESSLLCVAWRRRLH
jgi:hypothetical protein